MFYEEEGIQGIAARIERIHGASTCLYEDGAVDTFHFLDAANTLFFSAFL